MSQAQQLFEGLMSRTKGMYVNKETNKKLNLTKKELTLYFAFKLLFAIFEISDSDLELINLINETANKSPITKEELRNYWIKEIEDEIETMELDLLEVKRTTKKLIEMERNNQNDKK